MIFLRILSFFAGSIALFGSPYILLSDRDAAASTPTIALAVLTVLLFAAAFYLFAFFGHRMARSQRLRCLGAGMSAFQALAGAWLLSVSHNARALVGAAPLLCLAVFVFMAFVWPGEALRSHRPMRRRERTDELQQQ
jgi:uncharacterized membrane protein